MLYSSAMTTPRNLLCTLVLLLAGSATADSLEREWTSMQGAKVTAKLTGVHQRMISLVTRDGRRIRIPANQLSPGDLEYLRITGDVDPAELPKPFKPRLLQVVSHDGSFKQDFIDSYLAAIQSPARWGLEGFDRVVVTASDKPIQALIDEHLPAFLVKVELSRYEEKERTLTEYEETGRRDANGQPELRRIEIPRKDWEWKHDMTLHRFDGYTWKEIGKDKFPVDIREEGAGINKHSTSSLGTRAGTESVAAGQWLLSKLIWVNPLSGRVQGEKRYVSFNVRNDSMFPMVATAFAVDWRKKDQPVEDWSGSVPLVPGRQSQQTIERQLSDDPISSSDRFRKPDLQVSRVRLGLPETK